MVLRRLRNGQHFHAPCLGTREFPASVELIEDKGEIPKSPLTGKRDLGWMLYDLDFSNPQTTFSRFSSKPHMQDGVIDLTR